MADQALTDKVRQMREQGYQNSQIIDILQRDGHTSSQIFDALSHASIGNAGPQAAVPPAPSFSEGNDAFSRPMPPDDDAPAAPSFAPPRAPAPAPAPAPSPRPAPAPKPRDPLAMDDTPAPRAVHPHHPSSSSNVSTEEYIEAIIDEKWVELEDDVQKIVNWKNRSEQKLAQLSQEVNDLKDRFEKLHAALIGKIESYDKNILEVGAEIKAMEKVFSKVLPAFTDNVKQLRDITDDLGKKTKSN